MANECVTAGDVTKWAEATAIVLARGMGITTLKPRGSDRLDFHDVGVAELRKALISAYRAGFAAAQDAAAGG